MSVINALRFGGLSKTAATPLALAALVSSFLLCSCEKAEEAKKPKPPVPVTVAKVESSALPLVAETFGAVEPFASLSVRSKLTGKIIKLGFTPSQKVSKGDLLVQIDDRPYQATLKKLQAQLVKNEYLANDSERLLLLKEKLQKSGSVTESEMFTQRALAQSALAALNSDKAEIESTLLDIEYCRICAPFDGRMGDILIHEGSIVKANDDVVATLVQTKPVYVAFTLPERLLPAIRARMAEGRKVDVAVKIPSESGCQPTTGEISFIDNAVDLASGTIKMKATLPNLDERFWPGEYLNVSVVLSSDEVFPVIPSEAVMSGQNGPQLFVLKDDSTVELRKIEIARTYRDKTALVKGASPGESVVTAGQFRLSPGGQAVIKEEAKPEAPAAASGAATK